MEEIRKINIVGNPMATTGFGSHTLGLSKALYKLRKGNVSIQAGDVNPESKSILNSDIAEMIFNKNFEREYNVVITSPLLWRLKYIMNCKNVIGFGVWEGDKIPLLIQQSMQYSNQIIVPSEHTKKAFQPYYDKKIEIIPHGVDRSLFNNVDYPYHNTLKSLKSNKFTFLFNKGWAKGEQDRSNLPFLLRAFCEEFKPKENVRVLAHINPSYNNPNWNMQNEMLKLKLPNDNDRPEITVTNSLFNRDMLPQLYNSANCYVNVSKAEAFSIDILEAMACGLPTIIGGYGGQTDYAKNNVTSLILDKFRMVKASDPEFEYEETNWAEYDLEQLKKYMRKIYEDSKLAAELGENGMKVADKYTWENSAKKLIKFVDSI